MVYSVNRWYLPERKTLRYRNHRIYWCGINDHRFVLRRFGILLSSSWVFVLKYAVVRLRQNTSSNTTPISTKPLRTNTMVTISDEFFIRVSVSPLWQRSPVFQSVPPTLKIPIVDRNHRICVQRSWVFLFCFGRCVSRTYTSAYWERNNQRNETKRPTYRNANRWSVSPH